MKHFLIFALLLLAASSTIAQTPTPTPAAPAKAPVVFTEKDREFALKYLGETRDDYVNQLTGLSDAQLNFRAAEGRWTIAEIAEHITVTEEALFGLITGTIMKSAPPKCEDVFRTGDPAVVLSVTNRSRKAQAPEQVQPNGRWKTVPDLLASFDKTRNRTIDFMKNNKVDLRGTFMANLFGTLDSYQWFLFATAHSERHLAQLKEVKADAKYPTK